ncbi:MAG: glycosyltransferase [Candidatus Omnitrophota bacterium]
MQDIYPMIGDIFTWFTDYIQFSLDNIRMRSAGSVFLLFAPALLFDTTRYYITNTVVFIASLFESLPAQNEPVPYTPKVSAIIPVYNEGENLKRTIDSLLESDYPDFELIVVDDCSPDPVTTGVCRAYAARGVIQYLRKESWGGKPSSLNYGLQMAKGNIIIHFDGDMFVDRNTIREVVKPFRDAKIGAVSGNLKVLNDRESLVTRLQAAEYGVTISMGRRWMAASDTLQIASGAFSCFRKEALLDVKGTDPEYGEDLDITMKVRKMGFKIAFAPRAVGMTTVPSSWWVLFKQRVRWDRCYIKINLRKHRNLFDFHTFRAGDFFAGIQDLIFNLFLLLAYPVYVLIVAIISPELLLFILIATYLFYAIMDFGQFVFVILLSERPRRDVVFLMYAPLFFVYGLFLRTARTVAYILEFFRSDYMQKGYFPDSIKKSMPKY